jgi:hypothetical protein
MIERLREWWVPSIGQSVFVVIVVWALCWLLRDRWMRRWSLDSVLEIVIAVCVVSVFAVMFIP